MPKRIDFTNPKIVEAKEKFETKGKALRKITLPFEELIQLYANPRISYKEISKKAGVTAPAARNCFLNYFQKLFPRKFRTKRGRMASPGRRGRRVRVRSRNKQSPSHVVTWMAARAGFKAEPVYTRQHKGSSYVVRVNNKLCYVKTRSGSNATHKTSKRRYYHFTFRRDLVDTVDAICLLIRGRQNQVYIIPKDKLDSSKDYVKIYIPDDRIPITQGYDYLNKSERWKVYRNNWSLI